MLTTVQSSRIYNSRTNVVDALLSMRSYFKEMPKALFGIFVSLGAGSLTVSVDRIIISPFYFGG